MPKTSKDELVFGDGTIYKKKGDRCSCICHDPKNNLHVCKKCKAELWPGELCAIEKYEEGKMKFKAFTNVEEMITEKILIKKVCKKESKMKIKNVSN